MTGEEALAVVDWNYEHLDNADEARWLIGNLTISDVDLDILRSIAEYNRDDVLVWRHISWKSDPGDLSWWEGGFSESGRRHGPWTMVSWENGRRSELTMWYWYDELLDEGEWHLRNR